MAWENKAFRDVDFDFCQIAFYHRKYKLKSTFAKVQNDVAKPLVKQS